MALKNDLVPLSIEEIRQSNSDWKPAQVVANDLGVTVQTIFNRIRQGTLEGRTLFGMVVIKIEK